ncbi:CAP domain-containing protein [Flagellimonas aequoris]|uniref:CAP domain-containing protein n=1 Tax=Flagellimonas aequoris TaxID=2306997 RepID=A0A418N7F3_9FLAO|nr:CAP domain-containing protein [Allomuricauda aequoris]RIV70838.1 CAP domain-containing protein [Allomuricauda aequoris]TXK02276.1 CAP domain-containing protein [Allomuricauda aequoris]
MKKVYGIVLVIVLLFTLSKCSTTSTQEEEQYTEATLGNDKVTIDPVAMETDLLALVNQHRSAIGLNTLENSSVSYKYAEQHNDYMISKNSLSHDNFENRATKIAEVTNAVSISENVARYYTTAEKTLEGWLNSSSHKAAMEGDFTHTTLSVELDKEGRPYFTQIFIKVE